MVNNSMMCEAADFPFLSRHSLKPISVTLFQFPRQLPFWRHLVGFVQADMTGFRQRREWLLFPVYRPPSRDIIHLVAFACLNFQPLLAELFDRLNDPLVSSKEDHYQSPFYICVSVIRRLMQTISWMLSIGSYFKGNLSSFHFMF